MKLIHSPHSGQFGLVIPVREYPQRGHLSRPRRPIVQRIHRRHA